MYAQDVAGKKDWILEVFFAQAAFGETAQNETRLKETNKNGKSRGHGIFGQDLF